MKKKIVAGLTAVVMMVSSIVTSSTSYAAGTEDNYYWPQGPTVESSAAIVMEANTGAILYEKNIHDKHYPASITKILTTLLAVENCDLEETVTFSSDAVYKTEGTSIARDVDEQMSLKDTLYAVMLGSANECAYATAEHVGGTYENFVDMMNAKAKEIGCVDSHFSNPHGLPDETHVTSAYDMALISRAAIQNEKFRAITGTKKYTIPATNKHDEPVYLVNHNGMLTYYKTGKYVYEDCIGGKTGYTVAAGHTLVTYAERNGMLLICVVLKTSQKGQYLDTTNLLDYCFDNFQMINIAKNESEYSTQGLRDVLNFTTSEPYLSIDEDASIVLPKTADFKDAKATFSTKTASKSIAGTIQYMYGDRKIGSADVLVTDEEPEHFSFDNQQEKEDNPDKTVVELNFLVILMAVVVLALMIGSIVGVVYVVRNINVIRHNIRMRKREKENGISFRGKKTKKRRLKRRRDRY